MLQRIPGIEFVDELRISVRDPGVDRRRRMSRRASCCRRKDSFARTRIVSTGNKPASVATTTYTLVAAHEGTVLQRLEITSSKLTIGRLPENVLVLRDQAVSRKHAEIRLDQGQPTLVDVNSGSGTFVGSERLLPGQPVVLNQGSEIHIGPYVLTLEAKVAAAAPAYVPVYAPPEARKAMRDVDELPPVIARDTWPALLPVEAAAAICSICRRSFTTRASAPTAETRPFMPRTRILSAECC